jgi:hypothetical protein
VPQRQRNLISKGDPFGAAVPREQVLKQRGIDPSEQNSRTERKAELPHFTPAQEEKIKTVRAKLTKISSDLRQANEMSCWKKRFMWRS